MLWTSVTRWFKVSVCLAQRLACSGRWLFIVFPCTGPHLLVSLSVLQTFVEDWTQCGTVWQLWESADFVESPVRFLCLRNCRDVLASGVESAGVWSGIAGRAPRGLSSPLPALPTLGLPGLRECRSLCLRHVAPRVSGSSPSLCGGGPPLQCDLILTN